MTGCEILMAAPRLEQISARTLASVWLCGAAADDGSNPVTRTRRPKLIDKAPEIFSVDDLQGLLDAALGTEADVVPMLAIGAFAGLRHAEIKRLGWSEINLGFIEVTASKAKTAKRRIVHIQ